MYHHDYIIIFIFLFSLFETITIGRFTYIVCTLEGAPEHAIVCGGNAKVLVDEGAEVGFRFFLDFGLLGRGNDRGSPGWCSHSVDCHLVM